MLVKLADLMFFVYLLRLHASEQVCHHEGTAADEDEVILGSVHFSSLKGRGDIIIN